MTGATIGMADLPRIGPAALCLGVFDGVHRGHQALVAATRRAADERGIATVALLFDPPPPEVMHPEVHVPRLAPPTQNVAWLQAAGAEASLCVPFTPAVRELAPEAFLDALRPSIEVRALVMTDDSAFGRGRAGTPDAMARHGAAAGFDVVRFGPLLSDGDAPISSTRIRDELAAGNLERAVELLGRPAHLAGTVVRGDARGRELGYPTANLAFDYVPALPRLGIYAGRATIDGVTVDQPALVSVGVRPTFKEAAPVLVEAHLLDFDGDLYDRPLRLDLTARLRDELRFGSVEALVAQMQQDERRARALLA